MGRSRSSCAGLRVIVQGGSLAGLMCAIRLRQSGCRVEIFERSARPLEGRGAGIVLHPSIVGTLYGAIDGISVAARTLRYVGADGRVAHEQECPLRFTSYLALHRALLRDFDGPYHLACEVAGFESRGDRVAVALASGGETECELLVCADGSQSTARTRLLPGVRPRYAGYVGWRGTVVESQLAADAVGLLRDAISYCVLPDGHLLSYPIPSADGSLEPGSRNVNWVWYRNVASGTAFDALMTDTTGTRRAGSLAAGAVREEALVELRAHGERTLPAPVAQMVQRTANPFVQAVVEVAVPRMAFGRIALIGDAAFVLRPHIAAGTAKAADDAQTLSHCLARQPEDVPGALRRWETSQLVLGRAAMERSARAGARAQFEASWKIGEPLPFGLHVEGDSRMT